MQLYAEEVKFELSHNCGLEMPLMTRSTMFRALCLAAGTLALYGIGLTYSPSNLHEAEVLFGLHAHAIATTARDMYGRFMPLYFQMQPIGGDVWFHPTIVYATAPLLLVLPLTEWVIRLPSLLVAATNVVLLYLVAKRLFGREWLALTAAALLALTPAHFVNSRIAMDYVYPIPFVLGWLLCLLIYLEKRSMVVLFAGGTLLGIGFYSYIASVVMMPVYLLLTWLALYLTVEKPLRACVVAAAGFAWPLLLLPLWLYAHPEVLQQTLGRYGVEQVELLNNFRGKPLVEILEELRRPIRFSGLTGRASLYWYFFDPSFLFLSGGYANMMNSTRRVGVFLMPMLILLPLGLWRVSIDASKPVKLLLLTGFVTAPLAACLVVPEPYAIDREMPIVAFAALIAAYGVGWIFSGAHHLRTMIGVALVVVGLLHFGFFQFDYYGDYRQRSAFWFNRNHRGALEEILRRETSDRAPAIYLSRTRDPYIEPYWRLALTKHDRRALLDRTVYFTDETLDISSVPTGSLLLIGPRDKRLAALVQQGVMTKVTEIPEPGDPPFFSILRR